MYPQMQFLSCPQVDLVEKGIPLLSDATLCKQSANIAKDTQVCFDTFTTNQRAERR